MLVFIRVAIIRQQPGSILRTIVIARDMQNLTLVFVALCFIYIFDTDFMIFSHISLAPFLWDIGKQLQTQIR